MPRRTGGKVVGRGDLILEFDIAFPKQPIAASKLSAVIPA